MCGLGAVSGRVRTIKPGQPDQREASGTQGPWARDCSGAGVVGAQSEWQSGRRRLGCRRRKVRWCERAGASGRGASDGSGRQGVGSRASAGVVRCVAVQCGAVRCGACGSSVGTSAFSSARCELVSAGGCRRAGRLGSIRWVVGRMVLDVFQDKAMVSGGFSRPQTLQQGRGSAQVERREGAAQRAGTADACCASSIQPPSLALLNPDSTRPSPAQPI